MLKAHDQPGAERFHEWRKRVKYHWYHLRLLRPTWQPVVKAQCSGADELSDRLGDEHDLAVLRDALLRDTASFGDRRELNVLLGLIDRRRLMLRQQAGLLGERVYAEHPDALVARYAAYWSAWEN